MENYMPLHAKNYRMFNRENSLYLEQTSPFQFRSPQNDKTRNILLYIDRGKVLWDPHTKKSQSREIEFGFAGKLSKFEDVEVLVSTIPDETYIQQADMIINEMITNRRLSSYLYNHNNKKDQRRVIVTYADFNGHTPLTLETLAQEKLHELALRKNNRAFA